MPIDDLTDPHAFLPATRNYSNGCYLTINAGVHMFTFRFRGGAEVNKFCSRVGYIFEYAPARNVFRNSSGEELEAPPVWVVRRLVGPDECEVDGNGHHLLGTDVWDAVMHTDENWQPVEVIEQTGLRSVVATPAGVEEVFHHDPWAMQYAVKYCVGFDVMLCEFPEGSGIHDPYINLGTEAMMPCSKQVHGPEVSWKTRYFR